MYSALSTLNTTTEVPLSKAPNPQLLPGRRSINGYPLLQVCVFTAVCVCTLDGLNAEHKFRVWVTVLGCISRHLSHNFSLIQFNLLDFGVINSTKFWSEKLFLHHFFQCRIYLS